MLNSLRNWLTILLDGKSQQHRESTQIDVAQDVVFRETPASEFSVEALFQSSRTQWHFGDWAKLASLRHETFKNHPQRAKLALLAAAGRLQTGADADAREYIALAKEWGCTNSQLSRVLISCVHNSLGRAASIIEDESRALAHYTASVTIGMPENDSRLIMKARLAEQAAQLGLPAVHQIKGP